MEMIQNNSEMINNSVNETGADSRENPLPGKCGARCTREEDQTHIGHLSHNGTRNIIKYEA